MNEKERALLKRILKINSLTVSNLNDKNLDKVHSLYEKFEKELQKIFQEAGLKEGAPIWMSFSNMTEEQIRQEFSDLQKYPDLASIKLAVKGYVDFTRAGKVKTRETMIKHILETYRRGSFISEIGKEKETNRT